MNDTATYVSRGGIKLATALDTFNIDVTNMTCADLGCNVGGFTDCLLQRGAARVFAIDTGYGELAWKLRRDERVIVLERTNALYFSPADMDGFAHCDLVTIDLGWTRQVHAVPAALRWLSHVPGGRIISLIKPHYEADRALLNRGVLVDPHAADTIKRVLAVMPKLGVEVVAHTPSPIRGGAGKGRRGNIEHLVLLKRAAT